MPYIDVKTKHRLYFDDGPQAGLADTAGHLNYLLTVTIIEYLANHGLSYQTCNDIVGALDNCKDEFKRRVQNPYEDRKIAENGDVYPPEVLEGGQ